MGGMKNGRRRLWAAQPARISDVVSFPFLSGGQVLWRSVKENPDLGASYFSFFEDARVFPRKNQVVFGGVACGKSFFGAEIGGVSYFCGKRGRI
jgi:hypothetical protein